VSLLINGLSGIPRSIHQGTVFNSIQVIHNRSLPNVQSSGTRDQMM
jgi:hypothetical protein